MSGEMITKMTCKQDLHAICASLSPADSNRFRLFRWIDHRIVGITGRRPPLGTLPPMPGSSRQNIAGQAIWRVFGVL
jgi:hypothetical protein